MNQKLNVCDVFINAATEFLLPLVKLSSNSDFFLTPNPLLSPSPSPLLRPFPLLSLLSVVVFCCPLFSFFDTFSCEEAAR